MDASTKLELTLSVIGIGGGIIGAIGGAVGIIATIRTNNREAKKEIEEQNDYSFLAAFMQKQVEVGGHVGQIFSELEIGSDMWRRAEKMVERGILERGPNGRGYRIRGFETLKAVPSRREKNKTVSAIETDRRRY